MGQVGCKPTVSSKAAACTRILDGGRSVEKLGAGNSVKRVGKTLRQLFLAESVTTEGGRKKNKNCKRRTNGDLQRA